VIKLELNFDSGCFKRFGCSLKLDVEVLYEMQNLNLD